MKIFVVIFLLSSIPSSFSLTTSKTVLLGSSIELYCVSSFPPSWMWFGLKRLRPKTLASDGTKTHPNLKDTRYSFSKEVNRYRLQIFDIGSSDAGKYVCDGEVYHEINLNVMR